MLLKTEVSDQLQLIFEIFKIHLFKTSDASYCNPACDIQSLTSNTCEIDWNWSYLIKLMSQFSLLCDPSHIFPLKQYFKISQLPLEQKKFQSFKFEDLNLKILQPSNCC